MSIGRDDLSDPQCGCAALGSETTESDLIAGLEGSLRPTRSHQVIGAGELTLPLLDFALMATKLQPYVLIYSSGAGSRQRPRALSTPPASHVAKMMNVTLIILCCDLRHRIRNASRANLQAGGRKHGDAGNNGTQERCTL